MSRKHGAVYDDLGGDLEGDRPARATRGGARFLKRSNALGERLAGGVEEKTLLWVDPADCVMWEGHNRAYERLNEESCRDLIDAIRAQGRQEFPAVTRRTPSGSLEVICGARRHFAISWLRSHGYMQFRYLVEVRDLSDEEAFRLADVENRNRQDISDYERARDYARAIDAYYGGSQKAMAERLEVSQTWLSRYLALARLPDEIVEAFPSRAEIREAHARQITPLLRTNADRVAVIREARVLGEEQIAAKDGRGGALVDAARVVARLRASAKPERSKPPKAETFRRDPGETGLKLTRHGRTLRLEMRDDADRADAEAWLAMFVRSQWGEG